MRKILPFLAMLLSGCTTSRLNPLRVLPFVSHRPVLQEGLPDHSWMFQTLAIAGIAAVGVVTILNRGKPPTWTLAIGLGSFGVSVYGLSMYAIQETANRFIPWVVGVLLLVLLANVGLHLYIKYKESMRVKLARLARAGVDLPA